MYASSRFKKYPLSLLLHQNCNMDLLNTAEQPDQHTTVRRLLQGQVRDNPYLRVYYLLKRFNKERDHRPINTNYNAGVEDQVHLVKTTTHAGSSFTPLEFV